MRHVIGAIEVSSARSPQHTEVELDYPFVPHGGLGGLPPGLVAPYPPLLAASFANHGINVVRAVRVIVPRTGTLKALTYFCGTQSGNANVGIYDTAPTTRTRLFETGSVALPTANTWQTPVNPDLPVVAGDQLDFAMVLSDATGTVARIVAANGALSILPAGFWPSPDAGDPKLCWQNSPGSFILPATIAEGSCVANSAAPLIIARVE
jgi:hypothetical protein